MKKNPAFLTLSIFLEQSLDILLIIETYGICNNVCFEKVLSLSHPLAFLFGTVLA